MFQVLFVWSSSISDVVLASGIAVVLLTSTLSGKGLCYSLRLHVYIVYSKSDSSLKSVDKVLLKNEFHL